MVRFIAALFAALLYARAADDLDLQMKRVIDAMTAVERNAADPVASEQLFYQGAIPGLLRKLDPHSVFFDPGQFEQLKKMESSTQKGFGSVVSLLPGRVIVLQTLPGTPSAKAGLAPGDEIVGINGYLISRLDIDQLTELLTESRQRQAQLDVRRPGGMGILHMLLTPADVQSPSVDRVFFVGAGIGYIRAASFDDNTARQIKEGIEKLGGERLAGLVLDLRNNPGGLLTAALDTASLFLPAGSKIVTVRGRAVPEKSEIVPPNAQPYGFKLAILINEKTASASEIVSGAMQDHDRAAIVGEASYGKGLVQSVFPLSESTGLALTTALYYTPSGRSIQKPLDAQFALGATTAHPNARADFRTDKGRRVLGGGGIQPDYQVPPPAMNRLRAALEGSASFTSFATEYLRQNQVTEDFEVTPQLVDRFQAWAGARGIQPTVGEWAVEREFVRNRLKTEIFNQAFGVEKGDQVEAQRDPAILKALEEMGRG
jgi:carboxyl-terminal processing protease